MKLCEIEGLKQLLAVGNLGADPLWSRSGDKLTSTDIHLFYARAGLEGKRDIAVELIEQAQGIVIDALFHGRLPQGVFAALVLHELPPSSSSRSSSWVA